MTVCVVFCCSHNVVPEARHEHAVTASTFCTRPKRTYSWRSFGGQTGKSGGPVLSRFEPFRSRMYSRNEYVCTTDRMSWSLAVAMRTVQVASPPWHHLRFRMDAVMLLYASYFVEAIPPSWPEINRPSDVISNDFNDRTRLPQGKT